MPRHRFPDTRDRIETAAIQLFVDKGVAETTVRDIARAVDLSEGALYRHFESKEQLVWLAFERHYVAFARELQQLASGGVSARDRIAAMIRGFCQAHDQNPTLFRFMLFVQHGQLQKLAPDAATPVEVLRSVVAEAIAAGEIPAQDPDLATALIFGVVLEPVTFAAYGRLPRTMAPLCDRLVRAAWAALTEVDQ
jgi:AcrR family transcriptional regulator